MSGESPFCEAQVMPDDWTIVRCSRKAKQDRQGHGVCNQHARMYDKWGKEGRDPRNMSWYWWKWHDDVKPTPGMEL